MKDIIGKQTIVILIIFLLPLIIFVGAYVCTFWIYGFSKNSSNWSDFGAYIGGTVGIIFSLISIILLYLNLNEQRKMFKIEKFENKYYNLVRLHRDNISEIRIMEIYGRKAFVSIFQEYQIILKMVRSVCAKNGFTFKVNQITEISYLALYYGSGVNSTRMFRNSLNGYPIDFINALVNEFEIQKKSKKIKKKLKYYPLDGHQHRLAHYFRHLWQTVKFVDQSHFINDDEKKPYIKTIRAQLSNHEQALLFINSLTKLGKPWKDENLITKYELIKNLPEGFIEEESEINIKKEYPNIVFEYEEK